MGTLSVGRVSVGDPRDWRVDQRGDTLRHRISVPLLGSTLAETKAYRNQLVGHIGDLVAVTYSEDDSFNGFYIVDDIQVDSRTRLASLQGTGLFEADIDLRWVGDHSSTVFRSALTGILRSNDHGIIQSEAYWWHCPPAVGTDQYTGGGGNVTAVTRTTEDGDIDVFIDAGNADIGDPSWSCDPANYYNGAARIDTSTDGSTFYTRTGLDSPNTPEYFVLSNGLIEVRGDQSGGTSTGDISIRCYNGSWGSWTPFDIVWNSTTDIPEWHTFNIIRNDPEVCIVRLRRDAEEAPPSDKLHTLDICLRRGGVFATFNFHYSTAVALTVDRASTDAATAITPTGATGAMAVRDSADDGDGNRWVVGSSETQTQDTTNGGIDMTGSQTSHNFFIGFEINGSSAQTNDAADDVCVQYLGPFHEVVTARRR